MHPQNNVVCTQRAQSSPAAPAHRLRLHRGVSGGGQQTLALLLPTLLSSTPPWPPQTGPQRSSNRWPPSGRPHSIPPDQTRSASAIEARRVRRARSEAPPFKEDDIGVCRTNPLERQAPPSEVKCVLVQLVDKHSGRLPRFVPVKPPRPEAWLRTYARCAHARTLASQQHGSDVSQQSVDNTRRDWCTGTLGPEGERSTSWGHTRRAVHTHAPKKGEPRSRGFRR